MQGIFIFYNPYLDIYLEVYGEDIEKARLNALLQTFYSAFPWLRERVYPLRDYYEEDPNTVTHILRIMDKEAKNPFMMTEDRVLAQKLLQALNSVEVVAGMQDLIDRNERIHPRVERMDTEDDDVTKFNRRIEEHPLGKKIRDNLTYWNANKKRANILRNYPLKDYIEFRDLFCNTDNLPHARNNTTYVGRLAECDGKRCYWRGNVKSFGNDSDDKYFAFPYCAMIHDAIRMYRRILQ